MKRKYSDKDLLEKFSDATSVTDLARRLGLSQAGGSICWLKKNCERLGLEWKSKRNQGWSKGKVLGRSPRIPDAYVFSNSVVYKGSSVALKRRALDLGYINNECSICSQEPLS